ncbi:MAG: alanine--glyoxylate aminotransferase family protein [Gemmatimonadaceae bacterium]
MTGRSDTFGTFFLPGPTEVRKEVLEAMLRPMIPHRSAEFEELFARLQTGLQSVFQTSRPVFVSAASATGMMEAGVRCLEPGRVLSLVNGAFSERFANIAEKCGHPVDRYAVRWGEIHDTIKLDNYLTKAEYSGVTVVHSETSTGALNPVVRISDVAHKHGVRCLVDSVSGLGGAEVRTDSSGFDYILTGSQKAIAIPPGLAFGVASKSFLEAAGKTPDRGVYFDLVEMHRFATEGQVPSTPALSLLYALDKQLEAILAEGIENRWKRHNAMSQTMDAWLMECQSDGIDVSNIVEKNQRSPTVSTLQLPENINAEAFLGKVRSRGITVASGYGKLKSRTFRIGHMGDHSPSTLERCLDACRWALKN